MTKPLVSDELWEVIEPLLPPPGAKPKGGRPRVSDRAALTGILFVLRSGIPWSMLPQELGCGSPMTCWRRLRAWQEAGIWEKIRRVLLVRLRAADRIQWERAVVDSASVRAVLGGPKRAPIPRIGRKTGANITSSPMPTAYHSRSC
jgi:transposase